MCVHIHLNPICNLFCCICFPCVIPFILLIGHSFHIPVRKHVLFTERYLSVTTYYAHLSLCHLHSVLANLSTVLALCVVFLDAWNMEHIGLVVRMSILGTKGWRFEPQHRYVFSLSKILYPHCFCRLSCVMSTRWGQPREGCSVLWAFWRNRTWKLHIFIFFIFQ